jgi:hypothetical protein
MSTFGLLLAKVSAQGARGSMTVLTHCAVQAGERVRAGRLSLRAYALGRGRDASRRTSLYEMAAFAYRSEALRGFGLNEIGDRADIRYDAQ